jgi:hypothetical protein
MAKYCEAGYRYNNRWTIYTKEVRGEVFDYIQMSANLYENLQYDQDRPVIVVKLRGYDDSRESWAFSPDGLGASYADTLEELMYGRDN